MCSITFRPKLNYNYNTSIDDIHHYLDQCEQTIHIYLIYLSMIDYLTGIS